MDGRPVGCGMSRSNKKSSNRQEVWDNLFKNTSFMSLCSFAMSAVRGGRAPPKKPSAGLFTRDIIKRPNYRYLYHVANNLVLRC